MGKALTIQLEDDERLSALKAPLHVSTKVEVLRRALDVLEHEVERKARGQRWHKAVQLVARESAQVNRQFQKFSLGRPDSRLG